jgi:predicted PurR-regulated permease PerM
VIKFKNYPRYVFIALFIVLLILSFLMIKSYIVTILGAIILVYLFYPIYKKLNQKIKNKTISASLMLLLVITIIVLPIIFLINMMVNESLNLYQYVLSLDLSFLNTLTYQNNLNYYVSNILSAISKYLFELLSKFVISIPGKILHIFIMFFVMFYLFRDGERFFEAIKKSLPLDKKYREKIVKEFKDVTKAIIHGELIASVIQGVIGGLGFYIFGIPNPLFWGFVMFILALLPVVGPTLVWIPAAIILIFTGHIITGILLIIYGSLAMSLLDNILKPKLISKEAKIHPIIVLIGVIGGIKFFGIVGILLGPLILALLVIFIKLQRWKNAAKS